MSLPSNKSFPAEHQTEESRPGEDSKPLENILQYISSAWKTLTRSMDDCNTFEDVKTGGEPALYLPADFLTPSATRELQGRCSIRIEHLPGRIARTGSLARNQPDGLLYLDHPYVVPGGQFNEMYGWDSYFIIRGLLEENHIDLAKGMVENFFFEIQNYGGVLNANRTYYLSRSQPPFLSSMVLAVHEAYAKRGEPDIEWLRKAYQYVARDYEEWVQPPHLAGETGLSRYFDRGEGPVPEIMQDPSHYYRGVAHYFLIHEGPRSPHLILLRGPDIPPGIVGPTFPIYVCDSNSGRMESAECEQADHMALTAGFYKGDRSMRESGFDVSFRFGPFGAETHHFAPICLNSLLYKTEKDLEQMADVVGKKTEAQEWGMKAAARKYRVEKYLGTAAVGFFSTMISQQASDLRTNMLRRSTRFGPAWLPKSRHKA
jgi:alpha,alpha-trehalase